MFSRGFVFFFVAFFTTSHCILSTINQYRCTDLGRLFSHSRQEGNKHHQHCFNQTNEFLLKNILYENQKMITLKGENRLIIKWMLTCNKMTQTKKKQFWENQIEFKFLFLMIQLVFLDLNLLKIEIKFSAFLDFL